MPRALARPARRCFDFGLCRSAVGAGGAADSFAGGFSPGATIHAIVCPDGNVGAGLRRDAGENAVGGRFDFHHRFVGFDFEQRFAFGDALAFLLRQAMSLPVSCAISRAGMTTLKAIGVLC